MRAVLTCAWRGRGEEGGVSLEAVSPPFRLCQCDRVCRHADEGQAAAAVADSGWSPDVDTHLTAVY